MVRGSTRLQYSGLARDPATRQVTWLGRHRERGSPSGAANTPRAELSDGRHVEGMVFPIGDAATGEPRCHDRMEIRQGESRLRNARFPSATAGPKGSAAPCREGSERGRRKMGALGREDGFCAKVIHAAIARRGSGRIGGRRRRQPGIMMGKEARLRLIESPPSSIELPLADNTSEGLKILGAANEQFHQVPWPALHDLRAGSSVTRERKKVRAPDRRSGGATAEAGGSGFQGVPRVQVRGRERTTVWLRLDQRGCDTTGLRCGARSAESSVGGEFLLLPFRHSGLGGSETEPARVFRVIAAFWSVIGQAQRRRGRRQGSTRRWKGRHGGSDGLNTERITRERPWMEGGPTRGTHQGLCDGPGPKRDVPRRGISSRC